VRAALTYNIKKENPDDSDGEVLSQVHNEELKKILTNGFAQNYSHRLSDKFAEWDEMETIEAVKSALERNGREVILIEADENAYDTLRAERPDIVFNIAEGFGGAARESYIPTILEMLNIPYTASDPITTGICHDKSRCKEVLRAYGVPTPGNLTHAYSPGEIEKIGFPLFVKPLHEGSSKGIFNTSVVNTLEELDKELARIKEHYDQPALVEQYLDGREFTVALLGNGDSVRVLPIIEINMDCIPQGYNRIFSYEVKWYFDTRENKLDIFTCPAKISKKLKNRIEEICLRAYKVLRIRDWARIDVRCASPSPPSKGEEGDPYIIEVNPLPGILPNPDDNSCFPKAAREAGIGYDEMINMVLEMAMDRYGISTTPRKGAKDAKMNGSKVPGLKSLFVSEPLTPALKAGTTPTKSSNFEQKA
jgi:D-alanine-D-alanine ligase